MRAAECNVGRPPRPPTSAAAVPSEAAVFGREAAARNHGGVADGDLDDLAERGSDRVRLDAEADERVRGGRVDGAPGADGEDDERVELAGRRRRCGRAQDAAVLG